MNLLPINLRKLVYTIIIVIFYNEIFTCLNEMYYHLYIVSGLSCYTIHAQPTCT